MKKSLYLIASAFTLLSYGANSAEIDTNTAKMQAMDKITGRVSVINVPVNGKVDFGSLSVVVRSCKTRPIEETPENFAFVDVTDKNQKNEEINIFKGWMISSSPATNAVEHPIYDVWLLQCINSDNKNAQILTAEQLLKRDNLPMTKADSSATLTEPMADLRHIAPKEENQPRENKEIIEELSYQPLIHQEEQPQNIVPLDDSVLEFSFDEEDDITEN